MHWFYHGFDFYKIGWVENHESYIYLISCHIFILAKQILISNLPVFSVEHNYAKIAVEDKPCVLSKAINELPCLVNTSHLEPLTLTLQEGVHESNAAYRG